MADRRAKRGTLIEFSVLLVLHVAMLVVVMIGLFS